MGRYLLIELDDNDSALKLKKQIDQATKAGKTMRVVGYFASPPAPYCQCPMEHWSHEKGRPFAPSKFIRKSGWRKCLTCNLYRDFDSYLVNLLKPGKLLKPRMRQHNTKVKGLGHFVTSLTMSSYRFNTRGE